MLKYLYYVSNTNGEYLFCRDQWYGIHTITYDTHTHTTQAFTHCPALTGEQYLIGPGASALSQLLGSTHSSL